MAKKIYPLTIAIFFSIISILPLFHNGLPPTHDGEYHVIRFYEFYKMLSSGNFYPRWAPDLNNGYGLPLFNYVYPFPNYFAAMSHIIGLSFIDAFKLNMIVASIIGSIFSYLFVKEFFGVRGGVVASVFYTFSPYHFLDIYIRGSVGEVWALAFYPAVFWSLTKLFQKKSITYVVISSLFIAVLIFSHNILALVFSPFMFLYIVIFIYKEKEKRKIFLFSSIAVLLGIGMSAIFWLPALIEKSFVTGLEIYTIRDNFPELYQLLIPSWGSGFSESNLENFMSLQIGIANLVIVICVFISLFFYRNKKNIHKDIELFFLFWFVFAFFLMLKVSLPIWNNIPLLQYFQFPWRLLSLEIFASSFLAGSLVSKFRSKILVCILIAIVFFLGIGYTKPAYYHQRGDNYYTSRSNFVDGTNSPGNYFNTIWMNKQLRKSKQKIKITKGKGDFTIIKNTLSQYSFSVNAKSKLTISAAIAFFPGWIVLYDGRTINATHDKDGLLTFSVSQGIHAVDISFKNTFIRILGSFFSFISLFVALVLLIFRNYGRIKQ